ncbi:AAA family ATPase [Phaeovibrio sulfidiphilus]|uniref:AAA family ATPase n=1 Tax=Phaeovibrio sulfidiphilus TaxID=1220600 RepID=A0A8J7CD65_9PROT|nr:AAA family ATPase [Phaeovibrio sulfidiphilus]MBE1236769.1 AAA family ATPase [Phaeovibrio sulfidiphilus]
MYEDFYGLTRKPFSLLPDSSFIYPARSHIKAMHVLEYGMLSAAGFVVLSGEVGSGKTMIIRRYLLSRKDDVAVGLITNASQTFGNLMTWIAMAYGFDHRDGDYVSLYDRFVDFLLENYAEGKRTVLIIDEAQNLTERMLEDLRMLSNINNEMDQVLQIVLVGQPELLAMLRKPELRQFSQRITVHCHLTPLDLVDTTGYIRHRVSIAGGAPELFDDLACATIHYFSGGLPRLINLLCDVSLLYGFSQEQKVITFNTVVEAVEDREAGGLSPFTPIPDGWDRERLCLSMIESLDAAPLPEVAIA